MESNIVPFAYSGKQVRVVIVEGEPHFVAKDVCEALSVNNASDAVGRLDEDEKGVATVDTPGGSQLMAVISESGLYSLTLSSKKPEAKPFKRFVTHEVLPSIRETGQYTAPKAEPQHPVTVLDSLECMVRALRQQEERLNALEADNQRISGSIDAIQQAVVFHPDNWRENINKMLNRIAKGADNANAYQRIRADLYEELERRAHCDLNRRLDNYRSRLFKEGGTKTAVKTANRLDVIEQEPRLREIFLAIVKESLVQSGVHTKSR